MPSLANTLDADLDASKMAVIIYVAILNEIIYKKQVFFMFLQQIHEQIPT